MLKINKILLYDFSENINLINILKQYTDNIVLIKAKDDYQNILTKKDFEWVDCFITNVFDDFKNDFFVWKELKFIWTLFTDLSMFDLVFLKKQNIFIENINWQATNAVVEFSISILLNILRKTWECLEFSKNWWEWFSKFEWTEIFWKNVWVVWMWDIWKRFSEVINVFWTNIVYFSKNEKKLNYNFLSLKEVFKKSDFIFISTNLNNETNWMIKIDYLNELKWNKIILNPSRIELFNLDELYSFLLNNKNVVFWQDESINENWKKVKNKFLKLENFFITPHNAFNTIEKPRKAIKLLDINLSKYF